MNLSQVRKGSRFSFFSPVVGSFVLLLCRKCFQNFVGLEHATPNLVLKVEAPSSGLADLCVRDRGLGPQACSGRVGLGFHPRGRCAERGAVGAGQVGGGAGFLQGVQADLQNEGLGG